MDNFEHSLNRLQYEFHAFQTFASQILSTGTRNESMLYRSNFRWLIGNFCTYHTKVSRPTHWYCSVQRIDVKIYHNHDATIAPVVLYYALISVLTIFKESYEICHLNRKLTRLKWIIHCYGYWILEIVLMIRNIGANDGT